jgi:hypothetical protein
LVGGESCCFWLKKIPWWKRKCETAHCHDATASSLVAKVRGEVFTHFYTVSVQRLTVVCGIDCLACQVKLFVNNPLDVKENYEHADNFALHLSLFLFLASVSLGFPCRDHAFFPDCLSNHCQGLHHTFFKICKKNLMLLLSQTHCKIASARYMTPNKRM